MMAARFNEPELAVTPEQATAISKAVEKVALLYPVRVSKGIQAWTGLAAVLGSVYGPKVGRIMAKRASARATQVQRTVSEPAPAMAH